MSLIIRFLPVERESPRGAMALGCQLLVLCIIMSPWLRRLLSARPLLWLGKVSFGIYLLHGPILRSLLTICLYLGSTLQPFAVDGEPDVMELRYPTPGGLRIACSLVVFVITVGSAAHVWTMKMEPIFAKITKSAEQLMFAKVVESKRKEPSFLISPA
jgi:peptidoglycan/LPS O-acetylase OafA/YrhL